MTTFDKRKDAFENKFFREEKTKFRIIARRRKLLGLWVANQMNLNEEDANAYAMAIVNYGIEHKEDDGTVVKRVMEDIKKSGIDISEDGVRAKLQEFHKVAREQFSSSN